MSFLCWVSPGLSRQVCVELALIDHNGIQELGFRAQVYVRCWLIPKRRFRGGSYVLASLFHVTHGRGRSEFQMLVDIVFHEAGPSDRISVFDPL
jgi:hypothetical protein